MITDLPPFITLGKFGREQIDDIFHIFPRKKAFAFQANCLLWRQFAWNVKAYFLGKSKKNISKCRPLKFLPIMHSVNFCSITVKAFGLFWWNLAVMCQSMWYDGSCQFNLSVRLTASDYNSTIFSGVLEFHRLPVFITSVQETTSCFGSWELFVSVFDDYQQIKLTCRKLHLTVFILFLPQSLWQWHCTSLTPHPTPHHLYGRPVGSGVQVWVCQPSGHMTFIQCCINVDAAHVMMLHRH